MRTAAAIVAAKEQRGNQQGDGRYDAGFRADDTAGEPRWSAHNGMQKIVIGRDSAVRDTVEEGLAPVIGSMETDGAPQSSGLPEEKGQKQTEEHNGGGADESFVWIGDEMAQAEQSGQQSGGRPEADSRTERELDVSAEREFFEKSDEEKCAGPSGERRADCRAVKSESGDTIGVQEEQSK